MQTRCAFCKAGTELLYISYTDWGSSSGRAMAQAFSRRPLAAEGWVRPTVSLCEVCHGQNDTGTCFSNGYVHISWEFQSGAHPEFFNWAGADPEVTYPTSCWIYKLCYTDHVINTTVT
jgi:hypothetical protein